MRRPPFFRSSPFRSSPCRPPSGPSTGPSIAPPRWIVAVALLALLTLLAVPATAQGDRPEGPAPFPFGGVPLGPSALDSASTGGLETVERALAKLGQHRRLLVIAAHPDDEDTTLLTTVARELGGEAAYLSLSRGEGGQNLIGPELGVGLGLVRSQELLSARRLDGGRQYFTRAFDFGYTRSLDETFERWPREVLLEDVVRVIRRFRPQVIVSVFPDDGRGGHGQHQAAGVMAVEGFERAGEASLAAGDDPPWSPSSLYRATWWDRNATTLTLPTDGLDPLTGRTRRQTALASRSMHRSQDMGRVQPLGPSEGRYAWVAGAGGPEADDLFAGVDTRLEALAALLPAGPARDAVEAELATARGWAESARGSVSPNGLDRAAQALAATLDALRTARDAAGSAPEGAGRTAVLELVDEKIRVAEIGLLAAAGVAFDAWTDEATVAPGQTVTVEAALWNGGGYHAGPGAGPGARAIEPLRLELIGPAGTGWAVDLVEIRDEGGDEGEDGEEDGGNGDGSAGEADSATADASGPLAPRQLRTWRLDATPNPDASPTMPYFLRRPLDGDLYDWSTTAEAVRGEPFEPPPLLARLTLRLLGRPVQIEREVVQRVSDQARGEVRRPLRLVPRLEVSLERNLVVLPTGTETGTDREAITVPVRIALRSHLDEPVEGRLRITVPPGWTTPDPVPLRIDDPRGEAVIEIDLEAPDEVVRGRHPVTVAAEIVAPAVTGEGATAAAAYPAVDYPHIRPTPRPEPARLVVSAAPLAFPPLGRVAWVRGVSDRVPEALAALGVPLELLSGAEVAERDLSVYDAVVVGSRAYETDPDLGRANPRLLAYAETGGLVIVQYQQYQFVRGAYAPYPLDIARPHDRVTDETAPVRLLEPEHPVFGHPNRLGPEDWEGWVQERGLYFAHTWDERYRPLLAFPADPVLGGDDLEGALLVAPVGEGTWVYTGLAFFRQLPAGVPGAYRLFANLLALGD